MFLATDANIMPSLLWPWAIGVPVGFGFAIWASSPRRIERFKAQGGKRGIWMGNVLEGVGILRQMVAEPRKWAPALLGTALYWVLDMTAFYAALRTFGLHAGLGKVIIAYATGYAATRRSLPFGGAGITEFLMTYALYWVQAPAGPGARGGRRLPRVQPAARGRAGAGRTPPAPTDPRTRRQLGGPPLSRRRGSTPPSDRPTSRAAPPRRSSAPRSNPLTMS